MARYRRKEQSFELWFLGFAIICAVTFGAYKYMTQVVIDMGQGIVDRSVEQQRKQQQAIAEQREQEVRRQALAARELKQLGRLRSERLPPGMHISSPLKNVPQTQSLSNAEMNICGQKVDSRNPTRMLNRRDRTKISSCKNRCLA